MAQWSDSSAGTSLWSEVIIGLCLAVTLALIIWTFICIRAVNAKCNRCSCKSRSLGQRDTKGLLPASKASGVSPQPPRRPHDARLLKLLAELRNAQDLHRLDVRLVQPVDCRSGCHPDVDLTYGPLVVALQRPTGPSRKWTAKPDYRG